MSSFQRQPLVQRTGEYDLASPGTGLDNHLKPVDEHIVGHAFGNDPLNGETYFPLGETMMSPLSFVRPEWAR